MKPSGTRPSAPIVLVRFAVGGDDGTVQVLHNRFYVRAVDNLGRRDLDPAWILFQAKDFAQPTVNFTRAAGFRANWPDTIGLQAPEECDSGLPPDTLPIGATVEFRWQGVDGDSLFDTQVGSVAAYEYKLSGVDSDFRGGSIADTTATYADLEPGSYSFFVRPVDDAGWEGEECRYFHVNFDAEAEIVPPPLSTDGSLGFRISDTQVGSYDCDDPESSDFTPYDYADQDHPDPPVDAKGWVPESDTLSVAGLGTSWWVSFNAKATDPDGEVQGLDLTVLECSERPYVWPDPETAPHGVPLPPGELSCVNTGWDCAVIAPDPEPGVDGTQLIVGPLFAGSYKVVVAGVDDTGQRGVARADTIDVEIDRGPRLFFDRPGQTMEGCDCLAGDLAGPGRPADTVELCDNDTTYVVSRIQPGSKSDRPCALATNYEDGNPAPVTVEDYQAFPQPGDVVELEFEPLDDGTGRKVARMCGLQWARDLDAEGRAGVVATSSGWVTHVRLSIDEPPSRTAGWDEILDPNRGIFLDEFAPFCFQENVFQTEDVEDHFLFIEIRDWLQSSETGMIVADRTARYIIPFTAVDVSTLRESASSGIAAGR